MCVCVCVCVRARARSRMPGDSYRRRHRFLLCLCDVLPALINSLVFLVWVNHQAVVRVPMLANKVGARTLFVTTSERDVWLSFPRAMPVYGPQLARSRFYFSHGAKLTASLFSSCRKANQQTATPFFLETWSKAGQRIVILIIYQSDTGKKADPRNRVIQQRRQINEKLPVLAV